MTTTRAIPETLPGNQTSGRKPGGGAAAPELRSGWTTGACATAATAAAFTALATGRFPDRVEITLPKAPLRTGQRPVFAVAERRVEADGAMTAGIVKDAGDDPDVTHGALILATLHPAPRGTGVTFRAGAGVGTVTRPGLPIPPGEPAINPVPRRMMTDTVAELASLLDHPGDVVVTISVPGGAALAERTWNPRLGILGGISILGTTGVVVPYSCAAWIHSIHRGVDVARAAGLDMVAGCTGSTSEAMLRRLLPDLPDHALIDMGDFAGALAKYLRHQPVPRLVVAGGFAKLVKLAQGALDLHSSRSTVDFGRLAGLAAGIGAGAELAAAIAAANTAKQVLDLCSAAGLDIARPVAEAAGATLAAAVAPAAVAIDVVVADRAGKPVAATAGIRI
ncbi:cobalt-precorrin-5B (C(1))-methyltransferase [Tistrella mobilis]|uniref:cobalt-precorrin-5B (C(1))-methyltransferase n=1 Tax=Tistrella mobilis TaxID=171437 RepID=UPI0035563A5C